MENLALTDQIEDVLQIIQAHYQMRVLIDDLIKTRTTKDIRQIGPAESTYTKNLTDLKYTPFQAVTLESK